MPLYEYQCDACGRRFEAIQKFSDPPVETCTRCGGAVRKLQSAPAFHLKGTGWYISDYAKPDQAKRDAAATETDGGSKDAAAGGKDAQDAKDAAPKRDKNAPAGDSAPSSSASSSEASTSSSSSSASSSSSSSSSPSSPKDRSSR